MHRSAADPGEPRGAGAHARRALGFLADNPWLAILAAGLVAFAFWAVGTRTQPHELSAVFTTAPNLYPGLDVRLDGLDAGKIKKVDYVDGKAVVRMGIYDDVWPLHQGTVAALRFGTTIGNGTRMIDLHPGPQSAPEIPDHGIIADRNTVEATEFDDVFNIFDHSTRTALQRTLRTMGDTFSPRPARLGAAVDATAPALGAVGGLASDAAADGDALRGLVADGARVTGTLAGRRARIADLMTVARATFATFAANTDGITRSLDRFPGTLADARDTLGRVDRSITKLDGFMADLAPGARQLRPLARDLRPAMQSLRETVPAGVSFLRAGTAAAPSVTGLLGAAERFSGPAKPALASSAPMLGCVAPYAPEIAGLLATWSSWPSFYDGTAHYGRVWGNAGLNGPTFYPKPLTPERWTKLTGQRYALVRPPGYNAGQPHFMPECGAGPDGLDPSKDPTNPPPAKVEEGK